MIQSLLGAYAWIAAYVEPHDRVVTDWVPAEQLRPVPSDLSEEAAPPG